MHELCDVGEYLDYENCKCVKKLVDQFLEECTKKVEQVKLAKQLQLSMKVGMGVVLPHCTLCYFQ